ncbi:G-type lectin S-receptor-like serine/threonine-protein kinase At4g27290 [Cornus florida]|uniref:G-type lectin S-receptor-like serine/threonine-protein kinase At4g27290 n=1 Tax=Cornus florida TaxID=4283 RepID=UPI00289E4B88|nr:G-type lectin S-receptor-like serine/threonine-protein kinase At4g27290 [Cornus florida]
MTWSLHGPELSRLLYTNISLAADHLSRYQSINGTMTLLSAGKKFRLGFFSPTNSRNQQYLGIWFDSIPTQTIGDDGNLILQDHRERVVWSTNVKNLSSNSTVAQLLDSGNLVLRHESRDGYIWRSFDHPFDSLLAGMKLGRDFKNGLNWYLTSWKSADDPAPGEFTYGIDARGLPQLVIQKGSIKNFRSGPWDGEHFSGILHLPNHLFNTKVVTNSEEMYYGYGLNNESLVTRAVLSSSGLVKRHVWNNSTLKWIVMSMASVVLIVFAQAVAQDWEMVIGSGGCIRKEPLNCSKGEGFIEMRGIKLPDFLQFWINTSMSPNDCKMECLKNCSFVMQHPP